jgi:hypothetical protein
MSDNKATPEPSMEEILVSIRRILAEDEGGPRQPLPRSRPAPSVLDLTEAIGEDGRVRHIEPAPMQREVAAPLSDGRVEPAPPRQNGADQRLLSQPAAAAVSASLARLADAPRQAAAENEAALDNAVRETLRPMLQAWLDEHLPVLVERMVQAEIARLMGDSGKR